ncbi:DNA mismatch repair endonuclease MutL [Candidatus Peregrinibacteria bacterium]|jgi:DNA mismatch repair protein MutL|nr:DNA mismatch repair endonuclease MutL [Candidatus Peregrinibacteria bacterium]MBT4632103.1 DNA mismatch repair endonuclease MutL [Candidatus Peregrinibacteria bacterium]MBT5516531.1 DNA mismatch repair endonuclease MutL [Candidatus Peregrinibacteria bacterium]MBT5823569.1 DNA mismatch repair endonuclease MutL [Candidatus Peregrinibacteria bacterium]
MTNIQILSDELISQIAAGEVIERPASAVKELVENSIDAGASRVAVELEEGGLRKIRIVDNGHGVKSEQVRLAFERHATSKLLTRDDLFSISSLGFRGEALASIASIAKVIMKTRATEERVGREIEISGSKELRFEEAACEAGTDIQIFGLFQHTPARRKYMKTERTEYGRVFDLLSRIALAYPAIAFRLKNDGKIIFDLPSGQSLKERVRVLFGNETAAGLLPLGYAQSNLQISGFVGKPELARKSKKYQFIFVNGRAIENRALNHAVTDAFHSLLMHEKFPWYILDIKIDPEMVDVNVHPRKLEVKFVNQQEVFRAVRGAVHHALEGNMLGPVFSGENESAKIEHRPNLAFVSSQARDIVPRWQSAGRDFAPAARQEIFELQGTALRPVAQVANSYIVAESEEGMVLIDQHAAHERVRYAELMEAMEKKETMMQPLLLPLEIDLGVDGAQMISEHIADFEAIGFELEGFGGNSFLLRTVPAGIENRDPEKLLMDFVADVKQNHVKDLREYLLTFTACRGAVKFGDALTMSEMEGLIRDMEKTKHCTHCPHGRPAIITLTFDNLETMFKRKNF